MSGNEPQFPPRLLCEKGHQSSAEWRSFADASGGRCQTPVWGDTGELAVVGPDYPFNLDAYLEVGWARCCGAEFTDARVYVDDLVWLLAKADLIRRVLADGGDAS